MAKVSVIIPVFNVEKTIERCAKSLFEQTLDDIEYIFIDDCTQDNSIVVLKEVLSLYPHRQAQTKIITMPVNSGQAAVRKVGMESASGEYVIHCDTDDWVDVNMYLLMYKKAKMENLDIVWCDYYRTDTVNDLYVSDYTQPRLMQGPLWNKLVRRSLYKDNYFLYPTANKAEDSALMTLISYYAKSRGHIAQPLYYYYVNEDSICGQVSEKACLKKLDEEIQNTEFKISFLVRCNEVLNYPHDVILWKLACRNSLLPILSSKKYMQLWISTYKEVNHQVFFDKEFSFLFKVKFLLKWLLLNLGINPIKYNKFMIT